MEIDPAVLSEWLKRVEENTAKAAAEAASARAAAERMEQSAKEAHGWLRSIVRIVRDGLSKIVSDIDGGPLKKQH